MIARYDVKEISQIWVDESKYTKIHIRSNIFVWARAFS